MMMARYLKRVVSGQKTRYKDDELKIELDLAYVSDQIIVMGFPAVGVESLYRNHRADVQRFLSARHGSDFWVFNLCPVRENAYDESVFDCRVSRYPFPDHHVPPFLYLSLVTREIHTWLSGSDARVAVLHCKAGKGRSGTLACAYLLSLHTPLHDSFSEWSLISDREELRRSVPIVDRTLVRSPSVPSGSSEPLARTLEMVLDLHTSRRMKPPSGYQKHKMGVSIPSQQRWLSYWSQILVGNGPPSLQPKDTQARQTTKVKLTRLIVRMREPSRIQPHLVQAASVVITSAGKGHVASQSTKRTLWASLARYSDRLVDELEDWERVSHRSAGVNPFRNDHWDKAKMIRPFAQMGTSDIQRVQEGQSRPILTCILRPLDDEAGADWVKLHEPTPEPNPNSSQQYASISESSSHAFVLQPGEEDDSEDLSGILLEANREVRIKLFMNEIALGWVWLIPAFHMSPDSPSSSLVLSNDDIDFAIGIGKALVDIKISFAWHTRQEGS